MYSDTTVEVGQPPQNNKIRKETMMNIEGNYFDKEIIDDKSAKYKVIKTDIYEDRIDEYQIADNLSEDEAQSMSHGAIDYPHDLCLTSTTRIEKMQ
jgi:hypothetical protein